MFPDVQYPRMIRVKQNFYAPVIANVSEAVVAQLDQVGLPFCFDGARIAVAVGSRGITNLEDIVRVTIEWLKLRGASPFIVPAMGSHGGGSASGQEKILAEYGITEDRIGAPVVSSMDVVQVGTMHSSIPVYMDRNAYEADGVLLINRVKPHTQFKSDIESGLMKLIAIGLGKDRGASTIHSYGTPGMIDLLPEAARVVLSKVKVIAGLALVENAYKQIADVRAIRSKDIEREEKLLLLKAKELMPSLPVDSVDFLLLDEMGKEISGPGMDSSVTGRIMERDVPDPLKPDIKILAVLDITAASKGNAIGLGIADLTTERLVKKVNRHATYLNTIIGGFSVQGKIPMYFETDRELLQAAAQLIGAIPFHEARIIRAKNTLKMSELLISESLLADVQVLEGVEILGDEDGFQFDNGGLLRPFLL